MSAMRTYWGQFGLVVGVALAVRLVAAVMIDRQVSLTPGRICLIEGDAAGYWELGRKIAHGDNYVLYDPPRWVLRMPGFPVVLAMSQLLFGANLFAARCLLAGIGALACGFVFGLGRVLATERVAVMAGLATALSPPLIAFSPLFLSETAFAAALTANLWLLALLWHPPVLSASAPSVTGSASPRESSPASWLAISIGTMGAVTIFMRPTWLPIIPLAAAWHVILAPRERRRWMEAATMVVAMMVCLSPWVIRNAVVTHHFVLTTLWDGPSLFDGLHPGATGKSDMTFFEQEQLLDHMSEFDMNREYRRRAWQFARENPRRAFELTLIKAARYWNVFPNAEQFADVRLRWILCLSTLPLFGLAICGAWCRRRDWLTITLTAGPVLFFAAIHLLYVSSLRYRLPAEYPLWVLAAVGADALMTSWHAPLPAEGRP